jgi:hypothetical protein
MAEKREADDFEEDDADESAGGEDVDVDHLMKDLESQKRRGGPKPGEPAWRRLEKYMEQKRTAELLSDFDDYEIEDDAESDGLPATDDAEDGASPARGEAPDVES